MSVITSVFLLYCSVCDVSYCVNSLAYSIIPLSLSNPLTIMVGVVVKLLCAVLVPLQ